MIESNGEEFKITAVLIKANLHGKDHVVGYDNKLAFSISEDLKHFSNLTRNHVVLVGYKTAKEIMEMNPNGLPGRKLAVLLTRPIAKKEKWHSKVRLVNSIYDILRDGKIMIAGGASLYDKFADIIDVWVVTNVNRDYEDLHPNLDRSKLTVLTEKTIDKLDSMDSIENLEYEWYDRISKESLFCRVDTYK